MSSKIKLVVRCSTLALLLATTSIAHAATDPSPETQYAIDTVVDQGFTNVTVRQLDYSINNVGTAGTLFRFDATTSDGQPVFGWFVVQEYEGQIINALPIFAVQDVTNEQ